MAATILEFRSEIEKGPVKGPRRRRRSAEIVIFPGVRYERHAKDARADIASGRGIERDTLKLVE